MDLGIAHTPERFGRYVLLDRMGAGGMAEVFRAVMPGAEGFRRDLVIKRILSEQARAPNFIEMFGHEARISAMLHHPNIVQVFDFGLVDGSYFLAMELLRGCDLLRIMRSLRERGRMLPIAIAAHIAHQVARGLGHAHMLTSPDGQPLNIVHRDVSPSNIMCLRAGGVKLLDFGIASAMGEAASGDDASQGFKGKLSYVAPERLLNQPTDGRIDLFALGTVLWEVLTSKRLFSGKTDADKVRAVLERPIPPPSSLRPDVPRRLDEIVLKMLERDPANRYAPGHTLADELEQVVLDAKFQSRMLPALLNELFGTAPSVSSITLSSVSPEMLAVEATPSGAPGAGGIDGRDETPRAHSAQMPAQPFDEPSRSRSKRRKMIATAVVATVMGLGLAIVLARSNERTQPARSTEDAFGGGVRLAPRFDRPEEPAPPEHAELAPATVPPSASDWAVAATDSLTPAKPMASGGAVGAARPRPAAVDAPVRSRRAAARIGGDRITRGLSIDPFAEAKARAGAR